MSAEILLTTEEPLSEQDVAAVEEILNFYMSCNDRLKEIMLKHDADGLRRMVETGFLTKRLLGPYSNAIISETPTGLFASDPEDIIVGGDIRRYGSFGVDQLNTVSGLTGANSNVLIVGAHIGTLAIPLSGECSYVAAIEANPNTFRLLQMNTRLNQVTNCELFNIAANDKEEPLTFLLNTANSGGSKRKPLNNDYDYLYDDPEEIQVPGMPLDKFFSRRDFNLIVMDIEGSEYFALKGMQDILHHAQTLVLEFMPHHLRNVSGVTVEELLAQLTMFTNLSIPSLNNTVGAADFAPFLNFMYRHDMEDGGLIFSK